jgi:hypothetical protein
MEGLKDRMELYINHPDPSIAQASALAEEVLEKCDEY